MQGGQLTCLLGTSASITTLLLCDFRPRIQEKLWHKDLGDD